MMSGPKARVSAADFYSQKGLYDRTIVQYQQALVLDEDNVAALIGLGAPRSARDNGSKLFVR